VSNQSPVVSIVLIQKKKNIIRIGATAKSQEEWRI
jgi:hypothetical protein